MAISQRLYARLMALPKESMLNLMLAALDEMEGYNGQSKTSAIMRAIGADETDNGWVMPSKAQMRKDWKDNYPVLD